MSTSLDEKISNLILENMDNIILMPYDKKYYNQLIILSIKIMLDGTDNSNRCMILNDIPECFSYDDDSYIYNSDTSKLWLLLNGDTVYGFINVFIEGNQGIISGIYLDKLLRGSGMATQMLNKAIEFCKQKKCEKIITESPSYSPSASAFYIKSGFEQYDSVMEYNNTVKMQHYRLYI